ncbi:hypothetical protein PI125_g7456 [Phytophthora idaei]|nr:hypothetical protein PI125_g7456 [Phytophthora idaei]
MSPRKTHTAAEKQRVLDAHRSGRTDWLEVAASNGIPFDCSRLG